MATKRVGVALGNVVCSISIRIGLALVLALIGNPAAMADGLAITSLSAGQIPGDRLQVELEMDGPAQSPRVFKTQNPARVALDFTGVRNLLDKKVYPINQGAASNVYIAETEGRMRVVVNLHEPVPFDTKVVGNKVLLILGKGGQQAAVGRPVAVRPPVAAQPAPPPAGAAAALLPAQAISGFDFKRGGNGEGRLLISLANPNTVVNSKQEDGKVVINFLNTRLAMDFARRLDVSEFATPVRYIDTELTSTGTRITVTPQNLLYDYSLFQSEGLLTVEFHPLTPEEKLAKDRAGHKYTGARLSLNFQNIDVRSVIAILAEFTGQNVVAGDDVTGTITLKLDDVPWDEALDFIMMTKDLGKFETGNVTLISPLDRIKDYKEKEQKAQTAVEQLEPLQTEYIKINFGRADDFRNLLFGLDSNELGSCVRLTRMDMLGMGMGGGAGMGMGGMGMGMGQMMLNPLQQQMQQQILQQMQRQPGDQRDQRDADAEHLRLLSQRGSAVVDSRTNTLIVRETLKRLEDIKKMIRLLDVPVRQVMIESRIVIAESTFFRELGAKFGVGKAMSVGDNTQFGLGGNRTRGQMETSDFTQNPPTSTPAHVQMQDLLVDLGAAAATGNPYGALAMTLVRGADYVLNLELSALQDENRGEVISNPRVMTSDRCLAVIQQGQQIPYLSSSGQLGTNTVFVDAVLQLGVLPQITPGGNVVMGLFITKNDLGEVVTAAGDRLIDKRELRTSVQVRDGETVVLGGVFENIWNRGVDRVPFFSDLPGIGFLFRRTLNQDDKRELLIFLTPKIMQGVPTIN